jgi:hypothetical protein
VDERRNPPTKATLGAAPESWLRTHEAEVTTLDGYRGYIRRTIGACHLDHGMGSRSQILIEATSTVPPSTWPGLVGR